MKPIKRFPVRELACGEIVYKELYIKFLDGEGRKYMEEQLNWSPLLIKRHILQVCDSVSLGLTLEECPDWAEHFIILQVEVSEQTEKKVVYTSAKYWINGKFVRGGIESRSGKVYNASNSALHNICLTVYSKEEKTKQERRHFGW